MGRTIDANDLAGPVEIAQGLRLSHAQSTLTFHRRHADFPEPIAVLGTSTRVWVWSDVEAWARATGRLGSRLRAVGRKLDSDDLVGTTEIAERLGMAHRESAMNLYRRHDDFPEPIAVLGERTRVWAWPDVEAWAKATGRLPD